MDDNTQLCSQIMFQFSSQPRIAMFYAFFTNLSLGIIYISTMAQHRDEWCFAVFCYELTTKKKSMKKVFVPLFRCIKKISILLSFIIETMIGSVYQQKSMKTHQNTNITAEYSSHENKQKRIGFCKQCNSISSQATFLYKIKVTQKCSEIAILF